MYLLLELKLFEHVALLSALVNRCGGDNSAKPSECTVPKTCMLCSLVAAVFVPLLYEVCELVLRLIALIIN